MSRTEKRLSRPASFTGPTTMPATPTSPDLPPSSLGWRDGVPPARLVQMRKTARTAATESATTRRTGFRRLATASSLPAGALGLLGGGRRRTAAVGNPVPVVAAEASGRVLGQRVAVALA